LSGNGVDGATSEATAEEEEWEKIVASASAETVSEEKEWENAVHATSTAHTTGSSKAGEEEKVCKLAVLGVCLLSVLPCFLLCFFTYFFRGGISSRSCNAGIVSSFSGISGCIASGDFAGFSVFADIFFFELVVSEKEKGEDGAHVTSTALSSETTAEKEKWEKVIASASESAVGEEEERKETTHTASSTTKETSLSRLDWTRWNELWGWVELLSSNTRKDGREFHFMYL